MLDGTWHHAHCLYRDIPWLREYPSFRLSPSSPSRYRIRREPAAHCVSTVESVVDALRVLEPDLLGLDALLETFDSIIDRQIAAQRQNQGETRYRRRGKVRSLPASITKEPERLVVVYAESRHVASVARGHATRQLLYWTACRPYSGETFAAFRAPEPQERQPSAELLQHMQLKAEQIACGLSMQQLGRAWAEFLEPTDVLLAWNRSTLENLARLAVSDTQRRAALELRHVYLNLQRHRGCLDSILRLEHLDDRQRMQRSDLAGRPAAPFNRPIHGRALQRLANATTMLGWLREHGSMAPDVAPG